MDCTTADASPSASDNLYFLQRFEGKNLQDLEKGTSSAKSLTASFWVKSNKTGTYICELFDNDNSDRHINKSYTINSANTWEKKTITFAGDTTGTLDNDNNGSLFIHFWLGAGSTYTSGTLQTSWGASTNANRAVGQVNLADSTDNEWYITGVQLEAGTTASDFEFLPHDVNLQRCERYYQVIVDIAGDGIADTTLSWGTAVYYTSSTIYASYLLRTVMRTAPTLDQVTGTDIYSFFRNSNADNFNGITALQNASQQYVEWNVSSGVSGTAGQSGFLRTNGSTCFIALDSEL